MLSNANMAAILNFFTLTVPGPPGSVSAELVNATSVLLTWLPPTEENGIITAYEVYFKGYEDYNKVKIVISCTLKPYYIPTCMT